MTQTVVVPCPNCGTAAAYSIGMSPGSKVSGNFHLHCRTCHKDFKVEFRFGEIYRVKR
ncbi:MAG: hypothetical protein LC102_06515 [Ignavibacteriales bacterium]|nr:hypothetical protein [Ignavibacteriaceae bacterium]MBW7873324.1 hypothetical protein [Ignavibacteria bacterium]MBZ0198070.1 hypothetical protein [Ignavibacteriaceae bacterium]MCZ2143061.1 hypothetical protein [Ignavibacteriales bacterium]WKZ71795.1 MAG: hypothetical protein QY308_09205 [Ignavibacteriaceae bacterium]